MSILRGSRPITTKSYCDRIRELRAFALAVRRRRAQHRRIRHSNRGFRSREKERNVRKAEALHLRALRLTSRGKYAEAARVFRRAVSLARNSSDSNPLLMAALLNDFGIVSKYQGQFERAQRLYDRAAAPISRSHPWSAEFRATLYHNRAGLEHARGGYRRALLLARRGLCLRRKMRPMDPEAVAADEAALAAILVDLGRLYEAEKILRRVLRFYCGKFGRRHYETAAVLANLGALHAKRGNFKVAERTLRQALPDLEQTLGRNHPRLRSVRNNLAVVRARAGKIKRFQNFVARLTGVESREIDRR